jgi:hypothetical protein
MANDNRLISLAKLLTTRLERLSADSTWAHKASGVRGDLLRIIEALESQESKSVVLEENQEERIKHLIGISFEILEKAARDLI